MDKVKKYSDIITQLFREYEAFYNKGESSVKTIFIRDTEGYHYQLVNVGWQYNQYIHGCMFHLDIIDEKVWIHENDSEIDIGDELVERGVPKSDIVAGLIHPSARKDTEYANVI